MEFTDGTSVISEKTMFLNICIFFIFKTYSIHLPFSHLLPRRSRIIQIKVKGYQHTDPLLPVVELGLKLGHGVRALGILFRS